MGGIEAALSGTTLLVDHHASPSFVRGSLGALRGALEEVGLRSVLCYEVTDRNGREGRDLGIEENRDFVSGGATTLTRGMFGAHASFTLSEESLGLIASASGPMGAGLHVHVAEDKADVEHCRSVHGCSLPERLERHGLLGPSALLAHCVHLSPQEAGGVQARGAWIAHNPRSNMNNAVGHAPVEALKRSALGTDGIDEDMLAETRAAFLKMRDVGRPDAGSAAIALLAGGHRLASELMGIPFGRLDAGAPADFVVLEYRPPTPLTADNVIGHLLFGMDRSHVSSVLVAGRFVVRDRRVMGVDAAAAFERARRVAREVWSRMDRL